MAASVVSAGENIRDTAPRLSQKGYAVFGATKDHPSLVSLGHNSTVVHRVYIKRAQMKIPSLV